ncbi:MAG: T9SS type A sorting domain-containing protein [Bacteroidales bacterium]|nr:T9SS type A sorting domain-containing protein [Bacteroidales bacterium]
MKSIIIIINLLLLIPMLSLAQVSKERDVIASSGETAASGNIEISYTIGEVAIAQYTSGTLIVSEGFQQADGPMTGIEETEFSGTITLFPNPVDDLLQFEVNNSNSDQVLIELFDTQGKLVQTYSFEGNRALQTGEIDFGQYASGIWYLSFSNPEDGYIKTFKVVKN